MDGFRAYKYYMAIKLHFTDPKFDVFVNRGRVKGSLQTFQTRSDRYLFEKLARQFPQDKECIQYFAANFMYGNRNVIYEADEAMDNYKEFIRRKQSITRVFIDDLDTVIKEHAQYDFSRNQIPDVIQLFLAGKVTLETLSILNTLDNFVAVMKQNEHLNLLLSDTIMLIEKSKGFVKYDSYKIMSHYINFLEDLKGEVAA